MNFFYINCFGGWRMPGITLLLLLFCAELAAQSTDVEFRVNMSYWIEQGRFLPGSETVDIAGTFNGWGENNITPMTDPDNDKIYTATISLQIGTTVEFKTRINGNWLRNERPGNGNNRSYTVAANGIVEYWFNDEVPSTVLNPVIAASANVVQPGSSVQFVDASTGSPVEWQWSFPGGAPSSSSSATPTVTYSNNGLYNVTLTVKNADGDSETRTFTNVVKVEDKSVQWWNEAVFYEVFVRSFKDSNGDGRGDFKGLIEKLDYLNDGNPETHDDLGVTGIWLMPIQESPSYHGYDVTDYRKVEADYGSNEDFKTFMDEAHKRGIRVIVDYVMNHTSDQHPWFTQSVNNTNDKRNWFVWRSTNPGFNGPWGQQVWHSRNGAFYYGVFWGGMPDLNYSTPAVKTEMFDIAKFWLEEMKVDGFRLDAVKYIFETGTTLEDTPETIQLWKDFRSFYKSIKEDAFAVGEAWTSTSKVKDYVNNDALDYCFEFDLADNIIGGINNGNATGLRNKMNEVVSSYPFLQYGTFLTNHDIDRVMNKLGGSEAKAAAAANVLLTLPGIPYLYYGEEIGMTGAKPDENIRTPLQWNNKANAGFTTGTPWRPVNGDFSVRNIENQMKDNASLWANYHRLIAIRNNHPALRKGDYLPVSSSNAATFSFLRTVTNEAVLMVHNLSGSAVSDVTLQLGASIIAPGSSVLVELQSGVKLPITVNSNGGFSDVSLASLPAYSVFIFKLMNESATKSSVKFKVNMNQLISNGGFNPANESVDIVASFNDFGSSVNTLEDQNNDGVYEFTLPEANIGERIRFKYRINATNDQRAEFPGSSFLREYLVLEGNNIVLHNYATGTVTSSESKLSSSISVYPVPTNDVVIVNVKDVTGTLNYSVSNLLGVEYATSAIALSSNREYAINLSAMPAGIYLLTLENKGQRHVYKIVKR